MAQNRYQQAAERLKKAATLGHYRRPAVPPMAVRDARSITPPPPNHGGADPVFAPPPHQPQQPPTIEHQPYQSYRPAREYRPQPVRMGFGLGLGFAAGGAVFRLIIFLVGVVLLLMFFQAGFALIGF